jgi:hypothetical protein
MSADIVVLLWPEPSITGRMISRHLRPDSSALFKVRLIPEYMSLG